MSTGSLLARDKGLLPWIILIVVLYIVFLAASGRVHQQAESPFSRPAPVVAAPVPAPVTAPPVSDGLSDVTLPDGTVLRAAADGVEGKLLAFVTDPARKVDKTTWFTLDRTEFETDSATLRGRSGGQLDNVAAILKAFPKVSLKIGGYTDSTGDAAANRRLSGERAKAAAEALAARGIAPTRLESEGFGDKFPVADNATPEGRASNRRTDIRVTQK